MRKLMMIALLCLPMMVFAQNTWELPETAEGTTKSNPDKKYLAGAVPVVDGRVEFKTTIDAPGKDAKQVYDIVKDYLTKMTKEPNQLDQSRIVLDQPDSGRLIGSYQEWLVFKSTALTLDRTRLFFNLIVDCTDGKAEITFTRIHYLYEEERIPQTIRAEEWITDEQGLNRKKTKLARISGKFRRKTIDRKDFLFNKFKTLLQ